MAESGGSREINDKIKEEILRQNQEFSENGLRVLAFAYKEVDEGEELTLDEENGFTFIGLVAMIDPPREEAAEAVRTAKLAGIRPVMITGDHKVTAAAIAAQIGIFEEGDLAVTGQELDAMSDEKLDELLEEISVYARVSPENKIRIVKSWQKKGRITAMTGDGVNDAPALKKADIGVAMGITGTDVTKNVADMVIADDNFATIVSAVEEGRRIYDNIRKSIQFLLSSNLAEVLSVFTATMLGFTILKPVHLLWINLITDCLPALALGMEKSESDSMKHPPRKSNEGIFAGGMAFDVAAQGILVTVLTLLSYFIGHFIESGKWEIVNSPDGMTMAFLTLSLVEIFHSFNMRSRRASVFSMKNQNKWLWIAMLASLVLTTSVIYIPFLRNAFDFEHISVLEYAVAVGLAVLIIPIIEIVKLIQRKYEKSKQK